MNINDLFYLSLHLIPGNGSRTWRACVLMDNDVMLQRLIHAMEDILRCLEWTGGHYTQIVCGDYLDVLTSLVIAAGIVSFLIWYAWVTIGLRLKCTWEYKTMLGMQNKHNNCKRRENKEKVREWVSHCLASISKASFIRKDRLFIIMSIIIVFFFLGNIFT